VKAAPTTAVGTKKIPNKFSMSVWFARAQEQRNGLWKIGAEIQRQPIGAPPRQNVSLESVAALDTLRPRNVRGVVRWLLSEKSCDCARSVRAFDFLRFAT
jgi:hypothetical protein